MIQRKAFSQLSLLGCILAVGLLGMASVPSAMRARELAKRSVCANNLRAIGSSALAYADDHDGRWMCPPFRQEAIDDQAIDYQNNTTQMGTSKTGYTPGEVGYERANESRSAVNGIGGSTAMSTTRALWLLVRGGANTLDNFICPSSGDTPDPTKDIQAYYDFTTYLNVSYGYQVPFGPPSTRPRLDAHPRQVFIADKSPFYFFRIERDFLGSDGQPVTLTSPPREWRPYNSPNHGGMGSGEGQNAFHADGAVEFHSQPAVAVDDDNIYTLIEPGSWTVFNRIHGYSPHGVAPPAYPGQDAISSGAGGQSTTDSLIYSN